MSTSGRSTCTRIVAPTAGFSATPWFGTSPLDVDFDASASSDPDGSIVSYDWDFGDGATGTGATPSHQFTSVGTHTVVLTVTDGGGATATATNVVEVVPQGLPTAMDDAITADPAVAFDVLGNDFDADGDAITLSSTTQPEHGAVICGALGGCLYLADLGYGGLDEFEYTITDEAGNESVGVVRVTVISSSIGSQLVANDDELITTRGEAESVDVIANDDGQPPLSVESATEPSHGTVSCSSEGLCVYTPEADFVGFRRVQLPADRRVGRNRKRRGTHHGRRRGNIGACRRRRGPASLAGRR